MASKDFLLNFFTFNKNKKKNKKSKKMDSAMEGEQLETLKPPSPHRSAQHPPEGTPSPDSCHEVMSDADVTTPIKIEFQSIEEQQEEQPFFQVTSPARPVLPEEQPGPRHSSSGSGAGGIALPYGAACQEEEEEDEETYVEGEEQYDDIECEEEKPRYYEFYHNQPSALGVRCKSLENFSDDYKLQVLQWAYSKTVHSAGHHFRLERFIVRNWMMNEEKIVKGASERVIRKFERYDERVFQQLGDPDPYLCETEEPFMNRGEEKGEFQQLPEQ